jgi:hypothetical protein
MSERDGSRTENIDDPRVRYYEGKDLVQMVLIS